MKRPKFLVIKGRAGLGNRMLAAATGLLYARLTGRLPVVDWRDGSYSGDRSNAFPAFFHCPSCRSVDELPVTDSIAPAIWQERLHASVTDLERRFAPRPHVDSTKRYAHKENAGFVRDSTIDLMRLDYEEEILVMWEFTSRVERLRNVHQAAVPGFPPGGPAEILRELLACEFRLRRPIRERVERFRHERLDRRTVGVHVRYTDRRVRLQAILARLEALLERERDLLVFLATDSLAVKEEIERRATAVVSTPHWYSPIGANIHQSEESPDRFENGVEALVDLYLLAECDYLICDTTSSFARVATVLTTTPASHVVDVKPKVGSSALRRLRTRVRLRLSELQRGLVASR